MNTKRLIKAVAGTRRYIALAVGMQVLALLVNIAMVFVLVDFVQALLAGQVRLGPVVLAVAGAFLVRALSQYVQTWASYRSSMAVKQRLRLALFDKAYSYGVAYSGYISPGELVQIGVEGVEQLDNYYGRFLPQLIYSLLAPLILFLALVQLNAQVALVFVAFIPIIPLAIFLVQKLAKRVMTNYWGSFIGLADRFLDNVQGLVILKLYGADEARNEAMNKEAEAFRLATMRVLRMQLSNIGVMDLVAYGGAALGTFMAIFALSQGALSVAGCLAFILLGADFFLPLRQLGAFFHVAMNGLAAVDRLFKVLDQPAAAEVALEPAPAGLAVEVDGVDYGYTADVSVLKNIHLKVRHHELMALVGPSGCGKSTLAGLLCGEYKPNRGTIRYGFGAGESRAAVLAKRIGRIDAQPWLFNESVRANLQMADPTVSEAKMWQVLEKVRLADRLRAAEGLDTVICEGGGNFSGGQRQRLAIARLLLKEADLYIFDEATSNVDAASEAVIMEVIKDLCRQATVVMITHRLQLTLEADQVVFMTKGRIQEEGTAEALLAQEGAFAKMYTEQRQLETYGSGRAQTQERVGTPIPLLAPQVADEADSPAEAWAYYGQLQRQGVM